MISLDSNMDMLDIDIQRHEEPHSDLFVSFDAVDPVDLGLE